MVAIGELAPDLPLIAADGTSHFFEEWHGRPVLAIFLRWLG